MSRSSTAAPQEDLDAIFGALADGTRRRILKALARGPASVTELAAPFAMTLPAVSKHLRVLERAGLLRRERDGRFQRCHLEPVPLESAASFLARYRPFWESTLDELAQFVEDERPLNATEGRDDTPAKRPPSTERALSPLRSPPSDGDRTTPEHPTEESDE
jgi:DNA-binding transcriptional ArsR family regulator